MDFSKHFDEIMGQLMADQAEKECARGLWEVLLDAVGVGEKGGGGGQLHLLDEALTLQILALRMTRVLGEEPLFKASEKDGARIYAHPAIDSLAKTQERFRKIMKELLERMDDEAGGEKRGWPELMVPILEKAEGVFEDALEPGKSDEGSEEEGFEPRRN